MAQKNVNDLQKLPVGRLGIISPYSCESLGRKVDEYLVAWRKERERMRGRTANRSQIPTSRLKL